MKKCQQVDNSLDTWKEEINVYGLPVISPSEFGPLFALAIWHKHHTS